MSLPEPPRADPACPRCFGAGFQVSAPEEHAVATLCPCRGPCARCGGAGWVRVRVDGAERVGRCRCQLLPDRLALYNHAQLPGRYARASFETFDTLPRSGQPAAAFAAAEARAWVRRYQEGSGGGRGLILWGEVGRGKTHLLVSMVRTLTLELGVAVRFIEFTLLLEELKSGFERGDSQQTVMEPLRRFPVLAIDELGKGRVTEWELTVLDALITRCYNSDTVLLGSSNYGPGDPTGVVAPNLALVGGPEGRDRVALPNLVDRVGERVYSRLAEMTTFVRVGGDDFRRRDERSRDERGPRPPLPRRGG